MSASVFRSIARPVQKVFFDYLDVDDLGRILELMFCRSLRHRQYNV